VPLALSREAAGRLLVSSGGDRAHEAVCGSVKLRAHEGVVVELSDAGII